MKLNLKLPNGLEIDFEGDDAAFEQFNSFLGDLEGRLDTLSTAAAPSTGGDRPDPPAEGQTGEGADDEVTGDNPLDSKTMQARFDRVGATNHILRVTVAAQAAVEAGREGIDFPTMDRLYSDLAIPKPTWKTAFSNAKTRGLVQNVGRGTWKPTLPGENYARYGDLKLPRNAKNNSAPKNGGGEND